MGMPRCALALWRFGALGVRRKSCRRLAYRVVRSPTACAFRHVWPDSWGPRLDYILTNAVRALLDVPGATLLMLPRLLIDEAFRVQVIEHHVSDPVVRAFWQNEYAGYSDSFRGEAVAPIQNKIGKALMVPSLRNMLAQPSSTITFRRLMDEGAIVICNLAKGSLGESTAHLLGALITTAMRKPRCRGPTSRPMIAACSIFMPTSFSRSPRTARREYPSRRTARNGRAVQAARG